jgi:DEAD/DEAH box helicase domain-containing protein
MTPDTIVLDIETKNSFADVGGEENIKKLDISVAGIYSYHQGDYFCFDENNLEKLEAFLKGSNLLIGFAIKRFDLPVLEKYFRFDLSTLYHFDILEKIEEAFGWRIGLDELAKANLGRGKTGAGLEAIEFYRKGEFEKLKNYCLNDVKLTKELYELLKNQGYLWVPQRFKAEMAKLSFDFAQDKPEFIKGLKL